LQAGADLETMLVLNTSFRKRLCHPNTVLAIFKVSYELRLTPKALAALGAMRKTRKNVVNLAQLRRGVRANEG